MRNIQATDPLRSREDISPYLRTIVTTAIVVSSGAIAGVITARALGPSGRGELAVLQYYPTLMGSTFCFAIPSAIMFLIANDPDRRSNWTSAGVKMSIALSILGSLIFGAFASHLLPADKKYMSSEVSLVSYLGLGLVLSPNFAAVHWGRLRFDWCNAVKVMGAISYPSSILLLWGSGLLTPLRVAECALVIQLVMALAHFIRLEGGTLSERVPFAMYVDLVSKSAHFFSTVGVLALIDMSDRFILIRSVSVDQLGLYAVAFTVASPILAISEGIGQVAYVRVSSALNEDDARARLLLEWRWLKLAIVGLGIAEAAVSIPIVRFAFGSAFQGAISTSLVLVLAMSLYALNRTLILMCRARKIVMASTSICAVGLALLVGCGFGVSRAYGLFGFACLMVSAQFVVLILLLSLVRSELNCRWRSLWGLDADECKTWLVGVAGAFLHAEMLHSIRRALPQPLARWVSRKAIGYRHGVRTGMEVETTFGRISRGLDTSSMDALHAKWETSLLEHPESAAKYADYRWWLRHNIRRALDLNLQSSRPMRVLDLGCGPGYFLRVCSEYGHDAVGIELPDASLTPVEAEVFGVLCATLGVTRIRGTIGCHDPLCVEGSFDLIVGHLVCFNRHLQEDEWGVLEWRAFVENTVARLLPGGRLVLELNENPARYGRLVHYDMDTLQYLSSVGNVDRNVVRIIRGVGALGSTR